MPAVSPATAGIDFQSDEHNATDFCRPDPLYRPLSSFAGERARTRSLFTAVDLPMRGDPHVPALPVAHLSRVIGTPRAAAGVRSVRPAGSKHASARLAHVRTTSCVQSWLKWRLRFKSVTRRRQPSWLPAGDGVPQAEAFLLWLGAPRAGKGYL